MRTRPQPSLPRSSAGAPHPSISSAPLGPAPCPRLTPGRFPLAQGPLPKPWAAPLAAGHPPLSEPRSPPPPPAQPLPSALDTPPDLATPNPDPDLSPSSGGPPPCAPLASARPLRSPHPQLSARPGPVASRPPAPRPYLHPLALRLLQQRHAGVGLGERVAVQQVPAAEPQFHLRGAGRGQPPGGRRRPALRARAHAPGVRGPGWAHGGAAARESAPPRRPGNGGRPRRGRASLNACRARAHVARAAAARGLQGVGRGRGAGPGRGAAGKRDRGQRQGCPLEIPGRRQLLIPRGHPPHQLTALGSGRARPPRLCASPAQGPAPGWRLRAARGLSPGSDPGRPWEARGGPRLGTRFPHHSRISRIPSQVPLVSGTRHLHQQAFSGRLLCTGAALIWGWKDRPGGPRAESGSDSEGSAGHGPQQFPEAGAGQAWAPWGGPLRPELHSNPTFPIAGPGGGSRRRGGVGDRNHLPAHSFCQFLPKNRAQTSPKATGVGGEGRGDIKTER